MLMLQRENRVTYAPAPVRVKGKRVEPGEWRLVGDSFLLRSESGLACYYRKGRAITVDRPPGADVSEEQLWLNGSVYAAVACINGLFPFHASAVAVDGMVIAFTGGSGAGKSTLVAALTGRGVPLYCDDTLVLDLGERPPLCMPGHKRLKLWPEAAELAGVRMQELVSNEYRKHYCSSAGGDIAAALPLSAIVSLEAGDAPLLERVRGGRAIAALAEDHYTGALHREAQGYPPEGRLGLLASLASSVPVWRFARPFQRDAFVPMVEFIRARLGELTQS